MLRFELLAGRDLTYVTVIRGARGFVIYEYTHAGLACPGLQLDGAQVRYVLRADDVEPFRANETQIRRVLLGLELLRQVLWDDCVVSHRRRRAASGVSAADTLRQRHRGAYEWLEQDDAPPERVARALQAKGLSGRPTW